MCQKKTYNFLFSVAILLFFFLFFTKISSAKSFDASDEPIENQFRVDREAEGGGLEFPDQLSQVFSEIHYLLLHQSLFLNKILSLNFYFLTDQYASVSTYIFVRAILI